MTTTQVTPFTLEAPAPVQIPTVEQVSTTVVPLDQATRAATDAKITEKVNAFVANVSTANLNSDEFREMMAKADAAGRKEIADASSLLQNNPILAKAKVLDLGSGREVQPIEEMSTLMSKANPKGRDLLGPVKLLGIIPIPGGNKLRAYVDESKFLNKRIGEIAVVLEEEEDAQQREIISYDSVESLLYQTVQSLDRATEYLAKLDNDLEAEAIRLDASDKEKADAVRREALFYVRGNLSDVSQVKLLTVVSIGQIRQLRHTGRMTKRATNRIRTLGMAALSISQTTMVATHNQKQRMDRNLAAQNVVNGVIAGVGDALLEHTKQVIDFESNPVLGLQAIEESTNKTLEAISLYQNFQLQAVNTLKADNEKVSALFQKVKSTIRLDDQPKQVGYGDVLSL